MEIVPAVLVGVAAFVVAAVVSTAARSHVPAVLLGLLLLLAVLAVAGAVATQAGRRAAESEQARGVLADEQAALRRVAVLSPPGHGTALHVQLPADPMAVPALPGRTP